MKIKRRNVILITALCVSLASATGVWIYKSRLPDLAKQKVTEAEPEPEPEQPEVLIDINTKEPELPEYKEIKDEVTGETVVAEVQVNEPIEPKNTVPPEKPKAEGTYKNPEKPPEYKKEQIVAEEKPEAAQSSNNNKSNTASSGKVYIDGFGYVDKAGETKVQTGVSDGDINKMVGSMD